MLYLLSKKSCFSTTIFSSLSSDFTISKKSINVDFLSIKVTFLCGLSMANIIPGIPPPDPTSVMELTEMNLLSILESNISLLMTYSSFDEDTMLLVACHLNNRAR